MRRLVPVVIALIATMAIVLVGRGPLGGLRLQVPGGGVPAPTHAVTPGDREPAPFPAVIVPPAGASRVDVAVAAAAEAERGYTISVRVVSPAGKPVSDATIRFYDVVDLFGQREALIGTATTDGSGLGAISYLPATTGTRQIVARFAAQGTLGASAGTTVFEATVARSPYHFEEPRLAVFSRYVPYAAGVVLLAVWALIAFALLGTARGVVAGARQTRRKGETA